MNFLVIGGGSIGKRHIANLKDAGYKNIFCLRRRYDKAFDEEFQIRSVTSPDDLNDIKIDAVFVCMPTSLHIKGIEVALQKEAAIFMEKPLIHTKHGLKKAKQLLQDYRKPFFIGFMLRYHPCVKKIKEVIDSNILGKPYSARFEFGSYLPFWHPWEDHKISYASRTELGGGVINTITHELDLVQYFFGDPRTVIASSENFHKLDIEVEEIAEAIFEYENIIVTLHLDFLQKEYDRNIKILCDEGKIIWDWHSNKVTLKKYKEPVVEFLLPENFEVNQLYKDELNDFIEIIHNSQRAHPLNFQHAVFNTELLLLMHQSISRGVKLNFPSS